MKEIPTRQGTIPKPLAALRPRIIPVMDIMNGVVVRAIAGRREEYKPLVSKLTTSTEPLAVAEALRDLVGTDELYIADLDAIANCGFDANYSLYRNLAAEGFRLWVDAGVVNDACDEILLLGAEVDVVIAALETIIDPMHLLTMAHCCGEEHFAFSLDLRDGRPIGDPTRWPAEPKEILKFIAEPEPFVRRVVVLDLSHVGVDCGTGTLDLCAWTKAKYPNLELIAGGGIRGPEDLPTLQAAGVDGVLIASALHDGKFGLPGAPL